MAVNYVPDSDKALFRSDNESIGRWAKTDADRREALDELLNGLWANKKIGCLEREENATRWGWWLCLYRKGEKGPPKA